jgi:hypothetical protein
MKFVRRAAIRELNVLCTLSRNSLPTLVSTVHLVTVRVDSIISPSIRQGEALGESIYSSCSFLTLALDEVSDQRHAPAALCPGKGLPTPIV